MKGWNRRGHGVREDVRKEVNDGGQVKKIRFGMEVDKEGVRRLGSGVGKYVRG